MAPLHVVVLIAGIVLVLALLITLAVVAERKRRAAMAAFAQRLQFAFEPKVPREQVADYARHPLFNQGHSKRISNRMRGTANNIDVSIFDYRYTTGGGKNSQTSLQTVILFRSDRLSLPDFSLRPENVLHRIGKVFGYQDIGFDTHPEFSKRYLLRGPDEAAVRAAFTEPVLDHFQQHQGLFVEGGGRGLLVYRFRKRVKPDRLDDFMAEGFAAFAVFARA